MKRFLQFRERMEGVTVVREAVQVIEKSAASRIHLLRKSVEVLSEYTTALEGMMRRFVRFFGVGDHPLMREREEGEAALVVLTASRGVVGGLHHAVVNLVLERREAYQHLWSVGTKGKEYLNEEGIAAKPLPILWDENDPTNGTRAQEFTRLLVHYYTTRPLRRIDIAYPHFVSLARQEARVSTILPFAFIDGGERNGGATLQGFAADGQGGDGEEDGFPIVEPSRQTVFDALLRRYIAASFSYILLDATLAVLAARTVTAENALEETGRMLNQLRHAMLRERHRAVTQAQLELFGAHYARV